MTIDDRLAPDAPVLEAGLGERVEFIAIEHGTDFHSRATGSGFIPG